MYDASEFYNPYVLIEEVNKNRAEVNNALLADLKDILEDPIKSDKLLYLVPGLNVAKFAYEAGEGETTHGMKLDNIQRIVSLLEGTAITYCLAVLGKEIGGTATHAMFYSALLAKFATGTAHVLVMEKETVTKMLIEYSEKHPESTLVQALIRAVSVIPGYMFSNKEIKLEELPDELLQVNA